MLDYVLETIREEMTPTHRAHRRRLWWIALIGALLVYAALTVVMFTGSPLDQVDAFFYRLNLVPSSSAAYLPVSLYILIGQGVPASTIAALYAIRRSVKTRSWTPWVMFTIVLILLNTSVGAMKHVTGRLGPKQTDLVHTVWAGGTIFPSGHTANAVVMYGLIALIAPVAYRKLATAGAIVLSVTIGLGTVAVNTHWISDVFGGWAAGALVLLMLRPLTPPADRGVIWATDRIGPILAQWWAATPLRAISVEILAPPLALGPAEPAAGRDGARTLRWPRPIRRARPLRRRRRYALAHGP